MTSTCRAAAPYTRHMGDIDAFVEAAKKAMAGRFVCPHCGSASWRPGGKQISPTHSRVTCSDCGRDYALHFEDGLAVGKPLTAPQSS